MGGRGGVADVGGRGGSVTLKGVEAEAEVELRRRITGRGVATTLSAVAGVEVELRRTKTGREIVSMVIDSVNTTPLSVDNVGVKACRERA